MKYETIEIGQKAELTRQIKYRDILDFMMLSGDKNDLHINEDYAKSTEFKQVVVYGMIPASFISAVIGNQLPGHGALWQGQSLRFVRPVFVGDTITVRAEVHSKNDKEQSIVLVTDVFNQKGEAVIFGLGTVKCLE